MKAKSSDIILENNIFFRLALATGLVLLIPLVAMQFTEEVNWDLLDNIVMGTLLQVAYLLKTSQQNRNL